MRFIPTDVTVHFESDYVGVMESQGSFMACIELEGELEKNITVVVDSTNDIGMLCVTTRV